MQKKDERVKLIGKLYDHIYSLDAPPQTPGTKFFDANLSSPGYIVAEISAAYKLLREIEGEAKFDHNELQQLFTPPKLPTEKFMTWLKNVEEKYEKLAEGETIFTQDDIQHLGDRKLGEIVDNAPEDALPESYPKPEPPSPH